jgi:acetoin utilization protein AcuC
MYDYAALAAGATLKGAELILAGEARIGFNPSGGYHHAHAARAGGFCYLNDIVLGCMTLARQGKRVVFLDIDVHHCDGVQEAFYTRADVMTVSLHQNGHTLFPGTGFERDIGAGDGRGFTVNCPLPPGTYDEAYLRAFKSVVLPLVGAFKPDVIVLEIGADTLAGDPLAGLSLTNNVLPEVIARMLGFGKPILATGGGGYHVENTVRAWALAWTALCENEQSADLMTGMGGVMLQSMDWQGGLRDRPLVPDARQRAAIDNAIDQTIETLQDLLFPLHGL